MPSEGLPYYPTLFATTEPQEKMGLLMNRTVLGSRILAIKYDNGNICHFNLTIYTPRKLEDDEFGCEVHSDDVIFSGFKTIYGIDGIDAADNAIHFIDMTISEFKGGVILWPDLSPYIRSPVNNKMSWGAL